MKVKCLNLIDKATGKSVDRNDWLTVGQVYTAVFIEKPQDQEKLYRIIGDDISQKPMLFEAVLFEVESGPDDDWISETTQSGTFRSGPKEFMVPGFWGNLFEGEPAENKAFKEVVARLV
ncbi:hypothetical protein ACJJIF_15030 [Microbulbifer sp. SSSA002]|uniref:hypothetical protein n=1 Tax=Microbulbifer sp. SSSA002 TaxID=3243376 RepID=UPI0040395EC0